VSSIKTSEGIQVCHLGNYAGLVKLSQWEQAIMVTSWVVYTSFGILTA